MRKQALSLISLMVLSLAVAACDNPEQKEAKYIKRGNALMEEGELDKARVEFKNAARQKPTDAEPFYRLALVDEAQGDLRNAFAGFTAAEQQNAHFHPASLKIAQYLIAAERYGDARQRITSVLGDNPDNAEAHALLGALMLREKDLDKAEKEGLFALEKEKGNVSATSMLTGLYAEKGDIATAEKIINAGIEANPKNLALLMLRVMLYEKAEDLTKIAESYQAIFKLKPDAIEFRVHLAETYENAGMADKAEAALRAGVAALPDNWDMKHALVAFMDRRGSDKAEAEIKRLIQGDPDSSEPYFWLADLYAAHNDTDKAEALLNQVIEREDFSAPGLNARAMLARLGIKRGNAALAEKLVATVLAKAPDNRTALLIRANLSFQKGFYQSSISDLRTILRTKPDDSAALQLLGETLLVQGHIDLAIDTMKKLADIEPLNAAIRVRLAQMLHLNGDTKQALDIVTAVTKMTPDYPVAWETAARLSIDAEQWLPAGEALKKLAEIDGQKLTAEFLEGQILAKTGNTQQAIEKYDAVIKNDPNAPLAEHALRSLVEAYVKLNRIEAAAHYLETLQTDNPLVWTLIGQCYASASKLPESALAFDKAISAHPSMPDPYLARAELYRSEHKIDLALALLKQASEAAPADTRAPLAMATLLTEAGKYHEAISVYDILLAQNPELDIAANNLAQIIADSQSNDASALDRARRIAERFSGSKNPLLLDTLAWVYFRQGNVPLALTTIQRAFDNRIEKVDLPAEVHFHYGAILLKSGLNDKAKQELQQATGTGASYPRLNEAKKLLESL